MPRRKATPGQEPEVSAVAEEEPEETPALPEPEPVVEVTIVETEAVEPAPVIKAGGWTATEKGWKAD